MARKRKKRLYASTKLSRGPTVWLPSQDPLVNSTQGIGLPIFLSQKHSRQSVVGRLRWTCLLCRDLDPGSGTDAGPRKGCKLHGKGDHIKKVRV